MADFKNAATFYTDRDLTNARRLEVPDGTWEDNCFLVAANSNGIGISTGNEYNPKEQDWDRNDPAPTTVLFGSVIGAQPKAGMAVVCDHPGPPLGGGCRVVFIQATANVVSGGLLGTVDGAPVYNSSERTVLDGEWVWGVAEITLNYLLLEDGFFVLLETGSKILLESVT